MSHAALTALSPLDGRYARQTAPLGAYFSEFALIRYRVRIEVEYLLALLQAIAHPAATPDHAARLRALVTGFSVADAEAIKATEATIRHDVKAVEYWLKDRLAAIPGLASEVELVHLGLTSEDVNNLAYALMQRDGLQAVLLPALGTVLGGLMDMAASHRETPMLARTHGQPASPTTLGKELAVFVDRLATELEGLLDGPWPGKLTGATGTFAALRLAYPEVDWLAFSRVFVAQLGLTPHLVTTQIEPRDGYARQYDGLKRLNNTLLDMSQDLWRYVSDGWLVQRVAAEEVGSSAMPHKVNPIDFENAEGNLGLANALWVHLGDKLTRSRLQRDLSDSTVLRNVGVAMGHSLLAYQSLARGLGRIAPDAAAMAAALEAHPEVLAEAIQTVLRSAGEPVPYETLKALTRGRRVRLEELQQAAIELLPAQAEAWRQLSPERYIGLAPQVADHALEKAGAVLKRLQASGSTQA